MLTTLKTQIENDMHIPDILAIASTLVVSGSVVIVRAVVDSFKE